MSESFSSKISARQLKRAVQKHSSWMRSNSREGKRASLARADLRGRTDLKGIRLEWADMTEVELHEANLEGVDFSGALLERANLVDANLAGANLSQADLTEADLRRADLTGAKLSGADLRGAKLRDATLRQTDLTEARNLTVEQLAGTDLTGARLPAALTDSNTIAKGADVSKDGQKYFLSLILACSYALLTLATTQDAALVANASPAQLPVINTSVPIVGFYLLAPALLLGLYLYFHGYLHDTWHTLARLPAVFPDGQPLTKKGFPWLCSDLASGRLRHLHQYQSPLYALRRTILVLIGWWLVPTTLFAFWYTYLRRHHVYGTVWHIALLILAVVAALWLYHHAEMMLCREESKPLRWRESWEAGVNRRAALWGTAGVMAISSVSAMGMTGELGFRASLHGAKLELANLKQAHLERADLWRANLKTADLGGASLRHADLSFAQLDSAFMADADFTDAELEGTVLLDANLRNARLTRADLRSRKRTTSRF
jgi:uncharacterized protein YjbI with pentapeptide repeats